MKLCASASLQAELISSSAASILPSRMFSITLTLKIIGSCSTTPIWKISCFYATRKFEIPCCATFDGGRHWNSNILKYIWYLNEMIFEKSKIYPMKVFYHFITDDSSSVVKIEWKCVYVLTRRLITTPASWLASFVFRSARGNINAFT